MNKNLLQPPLIPRRHLRRILINSLLLIAVATPVLTVLSNHRTNGIVYDSLWGSASREKPEMLTENNIPHADVLAVLGGGLDNDGEPNRFQKRRERAAAIAIVEYRMSDEILLIDGHKPDGVNPDSTKSFFLEQVKQLSNGNFHLPEGSISVETESTSTATNLDWLQAFMEENGMDSAIVVTDESHRIRTEALIKIKKIKNVRVITVEQIIRLHNPREMIGILRQNAEKDEEWERSEKLKKFAMFIDPKGGITAKIERFLLEMAE